MKSQVQIQVWSLLKDARDYRKFLESYIEWKKSSNSSYGYASFAREAGFRARSYPRDVIRGDRQLTARSIPRFAKAMKLTGEPAHYFYLLVCQDRPDLFDGATAQDRPEYLAELLEKSRARLLRKIKSRKQPSSTSVYLQASWPLVYASLGGEAEGASIEEVSARSRVSVDACKRILKDMEARQILRRCVKTERYFSENPHLIFQNLKGDAGFKNFFLSSLKRAEVDARANFSRDDRLYFSSVVTMKRTELKNYRLKLRELMDSFAERAEHPQGEDAVTIVCGLFP